MKLKEKIVNNLLVHELSRAHAYPTIELDKAFLMDWVNKKQLIWILLVFYFFETFLFS